MISAEISCDIASLAIEAGDTIFTMANDIGSDGGFNVYIYLDFKGQLISKRHFLIFNSTKKRTYKFQFLT